MDEMKHSIQLSDFQDARLQDIPMEDIIKMIAAAVEKERNADIYLAFSDNEDRLAGSFLSFNYSADAAAYEDEMLLITSDRGSYDIPLYNSRKDVNSKEILNRIRPVLKHYADTRIYLDYPGVEQEEELNFEPEFEEKEKRSLDLEPEEPEPLEEEKTYSINEKRTQMSKEAQIDLDDVAKRMTEAGYIVKKKQFGNLVVTVPGLDASNNITVTRYNAYIERAFLKSDAEKAVYDKMQQAVHEQVGKSIEESAKKFEIIKNSPSIADYSILMLGESFVKASMAEESISYEIIEQDHKCLATMALSQEEGKEPSIEITYGKEYGNLKKEIPISEKEKEDFLSGKFYQTNISKEMDQFLRPVLEKTNSADLSLKAYNQDTLILDSNQKELYTCDREWLTKLGRLEDKLNDLKYHSVKDLSDFGHGLKKAMTEIGLGIAKPYQDGLVSGIDIGTGSELFKQGWKYGKAICEAEREFEKLAASDDPKDVLKALDQKISIKEFRDDVKSNMNTYVKAAFQLRENIDKMLQSIKEMKLRAMERLEQKSAFVGKLEMELQTKYMAMANSQIAGNFREMKDALKQIGQGFSMITMGGSHYAKELAEQANYRINVTANTFKVQYNEMLRQAKTTIQYKFHEREVFAEKLNNARINQIYDSLSDQDFEQYAKIKYWDELESSRKMGGKIEKIPEEERTSEDQEKIIAGKQAEQQQEQNRFIAEHMVTKLKELLKDPDLDYKESLELLAEEYHQAAVEFNQINGMKEISSYAELSEDDKNLCREVVDEVLQEIPHLEKQMIQKGLCEQIPGMEEPGFEEPDFDR